MDPVTVQFSIFGMENHTPAIPMSPLLLPSFFPDIHGYLIPCNRDRVRSAIPQILAIAIVRHPASCQILFPLAWKKATVPHDIPSTYQALPWLVPVALGILPRLFGEVCDQFVIHVLPTVGSREYGLFLTP